MCWGGVSGGLWGTPWFLGGSEGGRGAPYGFGGSMGHPMVLGGGRGAPHGFGGGSMGHPMDLGGSRGAVRGAVRIQDDAGQQPVVVAPVPNLIEFPRGDGGAFLVLPQRVQLWGVLGGVRKVGGPPLLRPPPPQPPQSSPVKPPSAMLNMKRGFSALSSRRPLARGSALGSFSAFTSSAGGALWGLRPPPPPPPLPHIPPPISPPTPPGYEGNHPQASAGRN